MTYRGRIKKGVVVLEEPGCLPEGTEVSVRPVKPRRKPAETPKRRKSLRPGLTKFAGILQDLPPDASQNVDHYLYGHPKQ